MRTPIIYLIAMITMMGVSVHAETWQPLHGHHQIPIWPGDAPDVVSNPKEESSDSGGGAFNVSKPTMTVYSPTDNNTGVAMIVFPGGGYQSLAMKGEGTDICDWLTSRGITCVLLKYRVPDSGPTMKNGHEYYPPVQTAVQDGQRTISLVRQHATEWKVDPHKVGVIGFSAGGHLAAAVSTRFAKRSYPAIDVADKLSCRPDFAILVYPGHLWTPGSALTLRSDIQVPGDASPTFIVQAEDDPVDPVKHSLTYYAALQKAGVPAEMHLYAEGRHAFGMWLKNKPISQWPVLVEQWLHSISMLAN
ncbi:MAG TPA: alpha/beta hydrolase [Steroidobacteraceae bacterium]|jgi:acetyl esterase/lipase|nr:alpha/beta hydrolase [Steroidobacteraceae bacterium]